MEKIIQDNKNFSLEDLGKIVANWENKKDSLLHEKTSSKMELNENSTGESLNFTLSTKFWSREINVTQKKILGAEFNNKFNTYEEDTDSFCSKRCISNLI
jgi:hypothetical protein